MSGVPVSKLPDDDMQAAPAALVRAGVQARELARTTGTAVVIVRDGILVEERVDDSLQPVRASFRRWPTPTSTAKAGSSRPRSRSI